MNKLYVVTYDHIDADKPEMKQICEHHYEALELIQAEYEAIQNAESDYVSYNLVSYIEDALVYDKFVTGLSLTPRTASRLKMAIVEMTIVEILNRMLVDNSQTMLNHFLNAH